MLLDIDVPDRAIQKHVRIDERYSKAFAPGLQIDTDKDALNEDEVRMLTGGSFLKFFNAISHGRRHLEYEQVKNKRTRSV